MPARPFTRVPKPFLALAAAFLPLTGIAAVEPPDAAAIARLHGLAFFNAVGGALPFTKPSSLSPAELTRLSVRMAEEQAAEGKESRRGFEFGRLFTAACEAAGDEQVDALAALFVAQSTDSYERSRLISPLALAWARRELRVIHREGRSAVFPGGSGGAGEKLPEALRAAPPELRAAWSAFRQAAEPFQRAFGRNREQPWTSVQDQFPAFYRAIDDFLLSRSGGDAPASERVSRFAWGGMCGTGSEMLHAPQDRVRLLALLRERRLEEAAGAALALGPADGMMAPVGEPAPGDLAGEVLAGLGLDWETLFAGAYLDGMASRDFAFAIHGQTLPSRLAARGSARGAGLLIALARFAVDRPADRERFIRPLALLVTPAPVPRPAVAAGGDEGEVVELVFPGHRGGGEEVERAPAAGPVPAALQREALTLLDALAAADTDSSALTELANALGTLRRPETGPTLRRLAAHPVDVVAEAAAKALAALGETPPARARAGPVRFRVRLNGEPLARTKVGWSHRLSENSSTSGDAETDADGVLGLRPEHFQDPARSIREVALQVDHSSGDTDPAKTAADRPWFQVFVPVPERLDQVTDVDVRVSALTLRVARADGQPSGSDARVRLQRVREAAQPEGRRFAFVFFTGEFPLPADGVLTLPRLAPGTYQIEVNAPARAWWRSGPVVLGDFPREVTATLQPGVDVIGDFVSPDGKRMGLLGAQLWRDGVREHLVSHDYRTGRLRGLPPGQYRLVLPASDAMRAARGNAHEIVPPESRHGGAEVEFIVGPKSPALLDLGDVPLAPAAGVPGR